MSNKKTLKAINVAGYIGAGALALKDLHTHSNNIVSNNVKKQYLGQTGEHHEADDAIARSSKRSVQANVLGAGLGGLAGGGVGALLGSVLARGHVRSKNEEDQRIIDKRSLSLSKDISKIRKSGHTSIDRQSNGLYGIRGHKPQNA